MISRTILTGLCAGAALLALNMTAAAQVDPTDHDAHHPEATEQALPDASPDAAPDDAPGDAPGMPGASGMGMMTPEMMQMMTRMMGEGGMPGMMGGMRGGPMIEGMPGPGMMRPGMMYSDTTRPNTMGMGMGMTGPGMVGMGGMPVGAMMHGHHGNMNGHGHGHGLGSGVLYGMPRGAETEMTPARVEAFLSDLLESHGNPRLTLGEITEGEDTITAEIVTTDGSLVQRLSFNRYPGLFRQID